MAGIIPDEATAAAVENDAVESELAKVYGEEFPDEAINLAAIFALIMGIIKVIQECRQSRTQQKAHVNRRSRRARIAVFSKVRNEFPHKSRREQLAFTDAIMERAAQKPELVDQTIDDAFALCFV